MSYATDLKNPVAKIWGELGTLEIRLNLTSIDLNDFGDEGYDVHDDEHEQELLEQLQEEFSQHFFNLAGDFLEEFNNGAGIEIVEGNKI